MVKIALFGTSADPPTAGHQVILNWLSHRFDYVATWAADNPFKSHQTPLEHRGAMLQLLVEGIESPRHNIGLHPDLSSSKTLETVERAHQRWPGTELTLAIGSDLVAQLPKWYHVEDLLSQVRLLVIPRSGYSITEADLGELRGMGAQVTIADLMGPAVSSTAFREAGEPEAVPPTVKAYIHRERLYEPAKTSGRSTRKATVAAQNLADFKVGVDNAIFSVDTEQNRLLVLLVMRHQEPFLGQWSLPGTLVRKGESLEDAAYRILAEKIRVENLYLEQLYTFGNVGRDPRESPDSFGVRYLSVSYFALVRYAEAELIADGVSGIAWYPLNQLPALAFDHNQILEYGYRRLRNKLEYSPIAFEVLPELFTLNDLYQLYTTVLGEGFSDYSNFRSRLLKLGFLKDTGVKTSRGAGRPASLYRFDADAFAPLKDKPLVFI
ncbi:MAG: nicotinate-nucleotide adenylyltransferase [Leptolyngbyaceae cyanobacterium bins.59]|nr:nicotinate-nucleotide adenylyltransferase [Leptolyngbyaceae cyanobacterium bins.59]